VPDRLVRGVRLAVAGAILVFVALALRRTWGDLASQPVEWTLRPAPAVAAVLLVWLMYVMLIEAWRRMLAGWGQRLGYAEAARIWVLSSLGKYVPGKVWAIAGMALMAKEAGVAAWAATGSAVILQALAIGSGAAVAGLFGAGAIHAERPGLLPWLLSGGAAALLAVAVLAWPPVTRRVVRLAGVEPDGALTPGTEPLVVGLLANVIAWLGYGMALWLLALATLPAPALGPQAAVAGFAASYVAGLVALFAPGGLVVREGLLIVLLQGSLGLGQATALAVASRLLLTITELGAAVPFLLLRPRMSRVA
jgi:hypothetical protein